MKRRIRIATAGVAEDYRQSLVPLIIEHLGYRIDWVTPARADLVIFGPFFKSGKKRRWLPKPLRPVVDSWVERLTSGQRPLTLFQTGENLRHDHIPCDYALTFDLAVDSPRHTRLPYWMEMVDWRHEGISGNSNPRFGALLNLDRLMEPLGQEFLRKPRKFAIFASHLREPRATLIKAMRQLFPVEGFGPGFDEAIRHHSQSEFTKLDVLREFAFNLCPENSMYPGYYTEKIPEAFMAGTLPVTWADCNLEVDFNPSALVNLAPFMRSNFDALADTFHNTYRIKEYAEQSLLQQKPSLQKLVNFLTEITETATS
jgi:hypothetical protein